MFTLAVSGSDVPFSHYYSSSSIQQQQQNMSVLLSPQIWIFPCQIILVSVICSASLSGWAKKKQLKLSTIPLDTSSVSPVHR